MKYLLSDNSRTETTTFSEVKLSFSLKLVFGYFGRHSFIKAVRGLFCTRSVAAKTRVENIMTGVTLYDNE